MDEDNGARPWIWSLFLDRIKWLKQRNLLRRTIAFLVTIFIYFGFPLLLASWYISTITFHRFHNYKFGSVSEQTISSLNAEARSGSPYITPIHLVSQADKLSEFERKIEYSQLLNINPNILFFDVYIRNMQDVWVLDSRANPEGGKLIRANSSIVCDSKEIPFSKKKFLIKGAVKFGSDSSANKSYVENISATCAETSEALIDNTFGKSLTDLDFMVAPGSGVEIIVEPEWPGKVIVIVAAVVIWIGFINILTERFMKIFHFMQKRFENDC